MATVGLVTVAEKMVTVEWSFPYCNDQQDGPASAVFGAPFPYERWSESSSLVYDFMPHVYLLNIVLLSALAYPWLRPAVARLRGRWPTHGPHIVGAIGISLCSSMALWSALFLADGTWSPVAAIARPPYDSLRDMRPVAMSARHYDCTPSTFWFQPKLQPPGPAAGTPTSPSEARLP